MTQQLSASISAPHPLSGKIVTVIGGSGFVGRHLAQHLFEHGARLRIASRSPGKAYAVRALANLGQVQFIGTDVTRPEMLTAGFTGSDMVVNLVSAFTGKLDAIQGEGAGRIAAAAKAAGVRAFIHVSVLGADATSDVPYLRTKAEGERAILTAYPQATILRPSVLFGPDDHFVMMLADAMASAPIMPVFAPEAKLQPLYVDDLAKAIVNVLANTEHHEGKIYEVAGPEAISMLEITQRIAAAQERKRHIWPLSDSMAKVLRALPFTPISADQYKVLKAGNTLTGALPGLDALGVTPRPIGLFLNRWMAPFRKTGRFTDDNAVAP
ncbi:complex I NDUFA9 subunit family protein [Novosphingobium sp. 9]|uniref:complex I NDUFA9 subunit family protein n=1 Tax=Novosphingobium sp. 9 TaxID=2025349 RepID=UPI0021B4E063|nr:complex I NDUFA9 subunit family protein [Novosphingobium sp. 9]